MYRTRAINQALNVVPLNLRSVHESNMTPRGWVMLVGYMRTPQGWGIVI